MQTPYMKNRASEVCHVFCMKNTHNKPPKAVKTNIKQTANRKKRSSKNMIVLKNRQSGNDFLPWKIAYRTFTIAGKTIRAIYLIYAGLLLAVMITAGIGAAYLHNFYEECRKEEYRALSKLEDGTFKESGVTTIYGNDGKVIGTLHNTGYKYVKISKVSEDIQNTYISSEDKTFMEHPGFSLRGIGRAAKALFSNNGRITQGGSTITQQLVKNTMLNSEQTFKRKLTEIFLAVDLEKKFTKADIMEYYLNTCFYGNNCKGIYAASEYYFGKRPSEITYKEAAMLAAISKSPSVNNPEADYDRSIKARDVVLKSLKNDGLITAEQYQSYTSSDYSIRDHESKQEKFDYRISFAVYCATLRLMREDGFSFRYTFSTKKDQSAYEKKYRQTYLSYSDKIRNGGYSIYTALDKNLQEKLQRAMDKDMASVSTVKNEDGRYNTQSSATCIDNSTGYVTAVIGGRGTDDEYNRAFLSERQPGSSIKPILDYGPAFDTGTYFPSRIVNDAAIKNGPKNAGGGYKGLITVRHAIADSVNTVAYNTLQDIGLDTGFSYMEKMRFSSLSYLDKNNSASAIGGFTNGVKNYELAGAYAAIENDGVWREPTCVKEIKSILYGIDIKDTVKSRNVTVYKSSSAYMLTSCMEDVVKTGGTGKGLAVKGQECAGKTGTTNNLKDGWFCGYTPYYTLAVWVGNDDGKPLVHNYGATYAGRIWHDCMTNIHKDLPKAEFNIPDTVEKRPVGADGAPAASGSAKDWFVKATEEDASDTAQADMLKREKETAEKALRKYEDFFITSENDVFRGEELYNAASNAVAACVDDDMRKAFLERLNAKYDSLLTESSKYGDLTEARALYEKEKEEKADKERQQKLKKKQEDIALSAAVDRFDEAESMINEAESYSESLDKVLSVMDTALSDLTETEEYSSYKARYDKAEERVESLKSQADDDEGGGE